MSWRPNASLDSLRVAAALRRAVRQWMHEHQIMEVSTPVLSRHATTDPHVLSVETCDGHYLHTSPEFAMKRLLAAHGGNGEVAPDIYQISPVFRARESGRFHNTEFTLLEWYRQGIDHQRLMVEVEDLLHYLWGQFSLPWPGIQRRRYGVEVKDRLGMWPEDIDVQHIQRYFDGAQKSFPASMGDDVDAALDLFMDEFVLPDFPDDAFTLLTDYPASQAALSRLGTDGQGRVIAERFEVYFGRIELGNGFHELKDSDTQRQRFEADLERRDALRIERVPMDSHLLEALAVGLPDCAGIAVGLERLQMVLGDHDHIDQVLSFNHERA